MDAVKAVPGATDTQIEQISGEAQLVVRADRGELARYGLNVADVMEVVSTAIGGEEVTNVLDGQRRFAVYLRVAEQFRSTPEAIGDLWVANKEGVRVPLSSVAQISLVEGPPVVSREAAQRRVVVQTNVRGRDMGGFVAEAQKVVAEKVKLPAGYVVTWGGQFENQQRAQQTLMVVVPVSLGMIFLLLYLSFGSIANALLIIMNVPFALIGGVFALWISGQFLSVPSSVGFIALFGVAVLNGVVMVSYFNQLLVRGRSVTDGGRRRCHAPPAAGSHDGHGRQLRPYSVAARDGDRFRGPAPLGHSGGGRPRHIDAAHTRRSPRPLHVVCAMGGGEAAETGPGGTPVNEFTSRS